MKRYIVFAYDAYYPSGGVGDIVGDTDNIEECKKIFESAQCELGQVLDTLTGETVLEFGY